VQQKTPFKIVRTTGIIFDQGTSWAGQAEPGGGSEIKLGQRTQEARPCGNLVKLFLVANEGDPK
jgi:hypothetical protein